MGEIKIIRYTLQSEQWNHWRHLVIHVNTKNRISINLCVSNYTKFVKVETTSYAAESSNNNTISKKNKIIEPLDGNKDLYEPLKKFVTKGDTLNKSK